jgi:hypothetical protein
MRRARRPLLLKLAFAVTITLACGCSAEGKTPDCPPVPLYDANNARSVAAVHSQLKAAADEGCITLPVGFDDTGAGGSQ